MASAQIDTRKNEPIAEAFDAEPFRVVENRSAGRMTTLNQWYAACLFVVVKPNDRRAGSKTDRVDPQEDTTMADAGTFHEAFLEELRDSYDAEKQLTKALPKLAKAAASSSLRAAFETHLEQTHGHVDRLERVFESLDEKPRGKHCKGIAGIIEEGKSIMDEEFDEATMDACLIAAGQRAEHYEMAAYGTLVAWAQSMGHTEAAKLLQQILDEEKAADKKLSALAEGGINQEAADSAHSDEDEDESPSRVGGSATAVAKRRVRR
jgi:ferritin-like metal-binding protein YciE